MIYKIRRLYGFNPDNIAVEAKRGEFYDWPDDLCVGSVYFLRPRRKYYRIVQRVDDVCEV